MLAKIIKWIKSLFSLDRNSNKQTENTDPPIEALCIVEQHNVCCLCGKEIDKNIAVPLIIEEEVTAYLCFHCFTLSLLFLIIVIPKVKDGDWKSFEQLHRFFDITKQASHTN
jgi:hypothetical protein